MKHLLFTTILMSFITLIQAQNISVEWSEKDKKINLSSDVIAALPIDGKVIVITAKGKKNYSHLIESDMSISKDVELELEKKESPIDLFSDGEKAYLFTMETSKKENSNLKRIYNFSEKSLKPGKKLGQAKSYYNSKSLISFRFRNYFSETSLSENRDWIAEVTENKVKGSDKVSLSLFLAQRDEDLTNNSNTVDIPFTNKEFRFLDMMVDNYGYISVLGYELDGLLQKKLVVFTYMRNLKDVVRTDLGIDSGKVFVGNGSIKEKGGKIFVGAFYNEGNKNWAEGVILFELNSKREIVRSTKKDIERSDFLRTGKDKEEKALKKRRENKTKSQKLLSFLDIVSDGSNGYYLISEQVKKYQVTNSSQTGFGATTMNRVTYYTDFENIVVSYVKDGELIWNQVIPKSYRMLEGWFDYSTQVFELNGQNYMIYASKTDKETLNDAGIESRSLRNIGLFMVPLKNEGGLKPQVISGGKEKIALPLPGNVFKVSENELILIGKKAKGGAEKLLLGDSQYGKASLGKVTVN